MPTPPELLNSSRCVRIIEVLKEMETEHAPHTDRHVAVTGEVKVNLQSVANRAHPAGKHADLACGQRKDCIRHLSHCIGEQQLFGQAADEPLDTQRGFTRIGLSRVDLLFDVVVLNNRPRNQLREERDIQQHLNKRPGHQRPVSVYVNDIGQALECEK